VGKLKERFYLDAAAEYQKRLTPYCRLTVTELPEVRLPDSPSPAQILSALEREGAAIRAHLPTSAGVIALCVEGKEVDSTRFSALLSAGLHPTDKQLAFLIGSSHGLHPSLKDAAGLRLSMSPMTFPHHLARVMLLEQIYRGFKIQEGSGYHK